MKKVYICDGEACLDKNGKRTSNCYVLGGLCNHTSDVKHSLIDTVNSRYPEKTFKTSFKRISIKDDKEYEELDENEVYMFLNHLIKDENCKTTSYRIKNSHNFSSFVSN